MYSEDYRDKYLEDLYNDEGKRKISGMVYFFYLWLLTLSNLDIVFISFPYCSVLLTSLISNKSPSVSTVNNMVIAIVVFFIAFSIITAVLYYNLKPLSIRLSVIFIVLKAIFLMTLIIAATIIDMNGARVLKDLIGGVVLTCLYIFGSCLTLTIYLLKSKKLKISFEIDNCKNLYL